MRIVVTGTRGIPNIQGGVETHCEELYPRLVKLGCEVVLVRRSCYVNENNNLQSYKGIKIKDIYAPRQKSLEAFVHTFFAILYAKRQKADVLHIHAIGPAIMTPLARLFGLKVVTTNHGPDYDRQKWGKLAKAVLKTGEKMGARYSNEVVIISEVINTILKTNYKRLDAHLVYNGVNIPTRTDNVTFISSLGLESQKYIFTLGRFVEEKGFDILIDAFVEARIPDIKLVIAGDADHPSKYSENLKRKAEENNVVLTGFIKGDKLNELFSHARLFVLPSFHEGLPISLLEAMSYNLDVLVSDIPANKEVKIQEESFFKTGNIKDLSEKLNQKIVTKTTNIKYDMSAYNWDKIAEQTFSLYRNVINKNHNNT